MDETQQQANELSQEQARHRAERVGDLSYQISLALREEWYQGEVSISFNFFPEAGGGALRLDMIRREIHDIRLNGEPVQPEVSEVALFLAPEQLKQGKNELWLRYSNDYDHSGSGFHKFTDPQDGEVYIYTDMEPFDAHRLFPCFDQPDIKGDYLLEVEGPKEWVYLHNSPEKARKEKGDRVWLRFERTLKFSTYLFALVVGPYVARFDSYRDIPLGLYCRASLAKYLDAERIFELTKESFAFLENFFEYPYPYGKYDQVFVPEFNFGAMENVACVTFSEHYIFRRKVIYAELLNRANTISHEMVHMWFGDLVTMKWWDDLWLNESFADYLSYYAMSQGKLFPDALEHFAGRKEWAYDQDQLSTTHPIAASARDTEEAFTNFDGISYSKGASVLRQLQYRIGPERFRRAMVEYMHSYAESNTTLADFLALLAKHGGADMDTWSKEWLSTTGVNTLDSYREADQWHVQQQPATAKEGDGPLRTHALRYQPYRATETGVEQLTAGSLIIGEHKEVLSLPEAEFVLWNSLDYGYIKVVFNAADLAWLEQHLHKIPDAFDRRLVWIQMWQMLQDAALSPQWFMELLEKHLTLEGDSSILDKHIVDKALGMLHYYLIPENRLAWSRRLHLRSRRLLWQGQPSAYEKQIVFFRLFVHSGEEEALPLLAQVLQGEEVVPGMELDQDKRWELVERLMAGGYDGALELLAQEERRDPSDLGVKKAFLARIASPDSKAKREAWESFTRGKDEFSTDYLRYGMRGFHRHGQQGVLAPYSEAYFRHLPELADCRDPHYLGAFVRFLYPVWLEPAEGLAEISNFLAKNDSTNYPVLLIKLLKERKDRVRRQEKIWHIQYGER